MPDFESVLRKLEVDCSMDPLAVIHRHKQIDRKRWRFVRRVALFYLALIAYCLVDLWNAWTDQSESILVPQNALVERE